MSGYWPANSYASNLAAITMNNAHRSIRAYMPICNDNLHISSWLVYPVRSLTWRDDFLDAGISPEIVDAILQVDWLMYQVIWLRILSDALVGSVVPANCQERSRMSPVLYIDVTFAVLDNL